MVYYRASRESLEARFCDHLADDGDALDFVFRKMDLLLHPFDVSSYDGLWDDQLSISSNPDSQLSLLTPEQHSIASKLSKRSYMRHTNSFFFGVQPEPGKHSPSRP
jgi:hypothetical protein